MMSEIALKITDASSLSSVLNSIEFFVLLRILMIEVVFILSGDIVVVIRLVAEVLVIGFWRHCFCYSGFLEALF